MTIELFTPSEVARMTKVSVKTVMRAIDAGQLEASRLTQERGGWRITEPSIHEWLSRRSNQRRERSEARAERLLSLVPPARRDVVRRGRLPMPPRQSVLTSSGDGATTQT